MSGYDGRAHGAAADLPRDAHAPGFPQIERARDPFTSFREGWGRSVRGQLDERKPPGEIEPDDLVYLDEIADRWIRIAEENRQKARR